MSADADRFLARFARFGAQPGRETYLALFHPEATLLDAGMQQPLAVPEIGDHIEQVLSMVRGFRMIPERWRERGASVFVEAYNEAEVAGTPLRWRSVYAIELRGDLVIRGRRYYDRAPLFAALDPNLPALPPIAYEPDRTASTPPARRDGRTAEDFVRACREAWSRGQPETLSDLYREDGALLVAGMSRPIGRGEIASYHRGLRARVPDFTMALQEWVGDENLLILEWRARGTLAGAPFTLGIAERFDLADGLALSGRAYFDTLSVAMLAG